MATLIITINIDGAAFEEDPGKESARILRAAALKLQDAATEPEGFKLLDSNGNTCGTVELEEDEDEELDIA